MVAAKALTAVCVSVPTHLCPQTCLAAAPAALRIVQGARCRWQRCGAATRVALQKRPGLSAESCAGMVCVLLPRSSAHDGLLHVPQPEAQAMNYGRALDGVNGCPATSEHSLSQACTLAIATSLHERTWARSWPELAWLHGR